MQNAKHHDALSSRTSLTQAEVAAQLRHLGVKRGGILLVHCAFSHVRPVEGGPHGLITALQTVLGPDGTLVMPSMTDDDERPFDTSRTPCRRMGVVADTFWRLPGVLRSDSPHAFAASGLHAAEITAPHPVDVPHGLDSPVGRVYEHGGQVLLLGIGHDANTTLHLSELLAGVRYRRAATALIVQNGRPTLVEYGENDHCCQRFALADAWLDDAGLQQRSTVGHAAARLFNSRDLVNIVVPKLEHDETLFLHPFGVDEECDEARSSLLDLNGDPNATDLRFSSG